MKRSSMVVYHKCRKVISSCLTLQQLVVASAFTSQAFDMELITGDDHMELINYMSTKHKRLTEWRAMTSGRHG